MKTTKEEPPIALLTEIEQAQSSRRAALNLMEDAVQSRQAMERLNLQLRDSERRFREMIDALPTAIYTTDAEGRLTHFNPAAAEFSGRTPKLGSDHWCVSWNLYHPDGTPMPYDECPMAIALKEGRVVSGAEAVAERPDGRRIWFTPYPTPLRNGEGKIVGAINMLVDVTERKKAEEKLRESEERFRTMADNISQLAWTCETLGNITWYNLRWHDYTGLTFEEMQPSGWKKVQHPEHVGRVAESVQRSRDTGEIWEDTFPLRSKSGEYRWFLSRAVPIRDAEGKIIRWFGTNTDITEERNAAIALQEANSSLERRVKERTAELEARNAEVLTHSNQLQELSVRLMRTQDDERRRISRELHDSVGQFLAHAKMSVEALTKREIPEKEARDLSHIADILEKCLTETRTISYLLHPPLLDEVGFASAAKWYAEGFASRSGIEAHVNVPAELNRLPDALELALFRILQESLTNVHRYSHSKSVDVQVELGSNTITLEVRDYGQGIHPQLLERLRSGADGGVGVQSMRERIKELGGQFEIESNHDGTLIRAIAPLSDVVKELQTAAGNSSAM